MSRVQVNQNFYTQTKTNASRISTLERSVNQFGTTTICQVYRGNALSLAAGWTKMPFDTAEHDPNSLFDLVNQRYLVPTTGYYAAGSQVALQFASGSGSFFISLFKTGIERKRGSRCLITTTDLWASTLTPLVDVVAGDYLEIHVYVGQPATIEIAGEAENWFTIARVA